MTPISEVYFGDCMDLMRTMPDKFVDLAIVDPPYGIGYDVAAAKAAGTKFGAAAVNRKTYRATGWDANPPTECYFKELARVSKNQIIWGGNYFTDFLPASKGWIFWYKKTNGDFSDGELAWTSFDIPLKCFDFLWNGMMQGAGLSTPTIQQGNKKLNEQRIHPTQKPIALYSWLLQNYAKPGWKILDTHLGSMGSRIAAYKLGFDFWGAELDPDYYRDGCKRFDEAIRMPLFDAERERKDIVQTNFFDALDGL